MSRATSVAGTFVLLLALLVGLAGCTQELEERDTPAPQAAATQQSVPPSTGLPTAQPGETVVSVFTPVPQAPGEATPTQALPLETPGATTPAATSGPAPTAAPTAGSSGTGTTTTPIVHVVQTGDTLSSIAARYGTSVQSVTQANNIVDPNTIYVGQRLTIPVGGSSSQPPTGGCRIRHTVKVGDWIWQIARDYGVSPYSILAANGLTISSGSQIVPGEVLCIP